MTSERYENFIFYLHEISISKREISSERIRHTLPDLVKTKQVFKKNEHKTEQKENDFRELIISCRDLKKNQKLLHCFERKRAQMKT